MNYRDWFAKLDLLNGHIGDQYPLCEDLPDKPFLRKGATYRLLGGHSKPLWYKCNVDVNCDGWSRDPSFQRLTLDPSSALYNKLCNPRVPSPSLPNTTLPTGSGQAVFNSSISSAPYCRGSFSSCDSNTILEGNNETSPDYTIDGCVDGNTEVSYLSCL